MDQPRRWANPSSYRYSFKFSSRPHAIQAEKLRKMYFDENLSASQIAQKLDLSKTSVLERLRKIGIRNGAGKLGITDPQNYRHIHAPIGWKIKDGKLIPNKSELKVCRIVVNLARSGMTLNSIARDLVRRKIKNRNGVISWNQRTISRIYKNWKEKL